MSAAPGIWGAENDTAIGAVAVATALTQPRDDAGTHDHDWGTAAADFNLADEHFEMMKELDRQRRR